MAPTTAVQAAELALGPAGRTTRRDLTVRSSCFIQVRRRMLTKACTTMQGAWMAQPTGTWMATMQPANGHH